MEERGPAQRVYVAARRDVGRCAPDAVLMEMLGFGIVWVELDAYSGDQLAALGALFRMASAAVLAEIRLSCGLRGLSSSYRRISRIGFPEENEKLFMSLRRGLEKGGPSLVRLELHGVPIFVEAASALGKGLAQAPALKFLSLAESKIGDDGFVAIGEGVSKSESLQDLVLSRCALSDASAHSISQILRSHTQRRNDVRWSFSLRQDAGFSKVKYNQTALQGILCLDISHNNLGDTTGYALANALTADDWIGAINMSGNIIGAAGVNAIFKTLEESNDGLVVLDLRENRKVKKNEATWTEAQEAIVELDSFLRLRSVRPDAGLLSRPMPKDFPNADGEDEEDSVVTASGVIASGILRWESGHQISSNLAGLIASLGAANAPQTNIEMTDLQKEIVIPSVQPDLSSSSSSAPKREKPTNKENLERQQEEKETAFINRISDRKMKLKKKRRKKKRKAHVKNKPVSSEKVADAFATEVKKAIADYAMRLDNPEVARILLERCMHVLSDVKHPEGLKDIEKSIEVLSGILGGSFAGAVAEKVSKEEMASEVVNRLEEIWAQKERGENN